MWARNINQAGSQLQVISNVTGVTWNDEFFLFPGVWNYEFALSAFNGDTESPRGPAIVAPSPVAAAGSVGPTCAPPPPWCPAGGSVSVPPVGSSPTTPAAGQSTSTGAGAVGTGFPVVTNGQCTGPDCVDGECTGRRPLDTF